MCGFVAAFLPKRATINRRHLETATDALAHRGPDGRGIWTAPGVGLGHRRLAIIDIAGGAQPFVDPSGDVCVFNGEVYNYRAARHGLPGPWRSESDTEVFLRAVSTDRAQGLFRLNGMWGSAVWLSNERKLAVIRDRMGIKPVYYAELNGGGVVFASEIRALLEFDGVDKQLDVDALEQLLCYRYVPTPRTLFRGVKKLRPGHIAWVDEGGLKFEAYDQVTPHVEKWSDIEAEAAYAAAFDRAVHDRLVADVDVGMFLSGGVDSTGILQSVQRPGIYTLTIGFDGGEHDDERAAAKHSAQLYGAQHESMQIGPQDYLRRFDDYVRQIEEPVLNDSAMATWFLAERARESVKVVLSGQGADEPLAGYDRYKGEFLSAWFRRARAGALLPWVERSPASEKYKRGFRSLGTADDLERAIRIYEVFSRDARNDLLQDKFRSSSDVTEPLGSLHEESADLDPLGRMLYADTRMWLDDDLLMLADKLSMAAGLELRVPFCDHRLVRLLETMPTQQKIRMTARGLQTKSVHRRVMQKRLPSEVINRRKLGFTNPMDSWLRDALRPLVETRLLGPDSALRPVMRPEALAEIWRTHQAGQDKRRQLFLLLTLESWIRQFSPKISGS